LKPPNQGSVAEGQNQPTALDDELKGESSWKTFSILPNKSKEPV
jgi:hypothetical protein